jgi:hypothetical protein
MSREVHSPYRCSIPTSGSPSKALIDEPMHERKHAANKPKKRESREEGRLSKCDREANLIVSKH